MLSIQTWFYHQEWGVTASISCAPKDHRREKHHMGIGWPVDHETRSGDEIIFQL